ncbi:MAG: argS [Francisellaceae bacterium]|nr:argS [Francisellaceae bacterium]
MNLIKLIKYHCVTSLKGIFPEFEIDTLSGLISLSQATQEKFGHYQCNSAMKLAKLVSMPPRDIAEKWVKALNEIPESKLLFSEITIAGPGFINFMLNPAYLADIVKKMLTHSKLGIENKFNGSPQKVVIDFSSPNIAKEMHVGHLRSTIIGDSIARILNFLGYEVLRLNHVGDWGTQFGMLIAFIKKHHPELFTKASQDIKLSHLMQWYKASKQLFDSDETFKKIAQQEVVALQQKNIDSIKIWEIICEISRQAYQEIYTLLDIDIIERGESFYNPFLPEIVAEFEQKNLLFISQGAKCIQVDGFQGRDGENLPIMIQKSDGGYNYATTDLAALKYRIEEDKADWLIYVIDNGQSLHLKMVFAAALKAQMLDSTKTRVDHVGFGLVLGADGKKFKTRSGDTEKLIDLLNTAILKAQAILQERHPNKNSEEILSEAKILGINAVKYADLSCNRLQDYAFSYEKMLRFEGNTAAFLMYAYVRIQSIKRKVGYILPNILEKTPIVLTMPEEIALSLKMAQFEEILESVQEDLMPNRLCDYLFQIAERFHSFFHHCRVEGSPEQNSRLLLCELAGNLLKQGLELLGLQTLEAM